MEAAAGLEVKGCLGAGEFFCTGKDSPMLGDKLITRNPHICDSENVVLTAVDNETTGRFFGHLVNTCIINSKSIVPQRLNGADDSLTKSSPTVTWVRARCEPFVRGCLDSFCVSQEMAA